MKKFIYITIITCITFVSCKKEESYLSSNNYIDYRGQLTGPYSGGGDIYYSNLDDPYDWGIAPGSGEINIEKTSSFKISITIEEFGPGGENLTFQANDLNLVVDSTAFHHSLDTIITFSILETSGISMLNPDNTTGDTWTLSAPDLQSYNPYYKSVDLNFTMENSDFIIGASIYCVKDTIN